MHAEPIVASGLSKNFGRKRVLDDLTLKVPEGSVTALLGRNGAGKSTLLRILTGLLPRSEGEVSVLGIDPGKKPVKVKARIGYVAEETPFHPKWRVRDAIGLVRALRKKAWDDAEEKRLIDAFSLPVAEKIGNLSKGYKAKLALLLAFAHRPEVILLDEPASGLDPVVRREVLASLVDAIHGEGRTVLLSSHLMEDVERLADRVAFLSGGKIVLEGEAEEIRGRARRVSVGPVTGETDLALLPGDPLVHRRNGEAVLTYVGGATEAVAALRDSNRFERIDEAGVNLEDLFVDLLAEEMEIEEVAPCGA